MLISLYIVAFVTCQESDEAAEAEKAAAVEEVRPSLEVILPPTTSRLLALAWPVASSQ